MRGYLKILFSLSIFTLFASTGVLAAPPGSVGSAGCYDFGDDPILVPGQSQQSNNQFAVPNGQASDTVGSAGDVCPPTNGPSNSRPVISVSNTSVSVSAGTLITEAFVRQGVSANDAEDGNITANIVVNPPQFNFNAQSGINYVYTFDVQDSQGLAAIQRSKTISVPVNLPPSINVANYNPNLQAGITLTAAMVRSGVTASDPEDGNLTSQISISGPNLPLTTTAGSSYTFTFSVSDSQGLPAPAQNKTFLVDVPNTPPVISVNPAQLVAAPGTVLTAAYVLAGVSATDAEDGNIVLNSGNITGPLGQSVAAGSSYSFTFNVSDSGGLPANPQTRVITGQSNQIILLSPSNNQVGTSVRPTFEWTTLHSVPANTTYRLKITANPSCSTADSQLSFDVTGTQFAVVDFDIPQGTHYWCVKSDQLGIPYTAPFNFRVRTADLPVPNISILPLSSAEQRSGQEDFVIEGVSGEVGSQAVIYRVIDGSIFEVGSVMMSNDGSFNFTTQVPSNAESANFQYIARTKRGTEFGAPSDIATYYFDPALTVSPVELVHYSPQTNGKFRWIGSEDATTYEIWRRVGLELCDPNTENCYQSTKPFKRIAELEAANANIENGYIVFQDPNYMSGAPNGSSYFVSVRNAAGSVSLRSNSISFEDARIPALTNTMSFHHIAGSDGYSIDAFICDSSNLYESDNSADLIAYVQYAERGIGQDCSSFNYDQAATTSQQVFDSLLRQNFSSYGLQSCVIPVTYFGRPGSNYCARTCVSDITTNEVVCSDGDSFNTPDDTTSPGFSGITNAIPQNDGFSALVQWERAISSAPGIETIQYEVKYTKELGSDGFPVFSGNSFIVEDEDRTEAVITGLDTGEKYYFEVHAIDTAGNRSGVDEFLDRNLLDNRPEIRSLVFDQLPNPHRPEQKRLALSVVDREAAFGDVVALQRVEYRRPGGEWVAFDLAEDLIVNQSQMNSLFAASSPGETNETEFTLDTRQHFVKLSAGEIKVTIADSHGLESEKIVNVALLQGASDHANYGASDNASFACSSSHNSKASPIDFLFLLLIGFGLWALERKLRKTSH